MHLPDINVWLALAFEAHAHHRPAADWFDNQESGSCAFCRFTPQGLLRLGTNPAVFGDEALSMSRAWACYDLLLSDERVYFREEPTGIENLWRKHSRHRKYSHKVWSDAYLAAFAEAAGIEVVTFDRGFANYKGPEVTVLAP